MRVNPRRVRLTVERIDPWSVLKMAVLLSVAMGVALVVMSATLWTILSGMGVFSSIDSFVQQLTGDSAQKFDVMRYLGFGRILSLSVIIAVIDVVLMTAIATLGAFLYNICAALVGGIHVTLADE